MIARIGPVTDVAAIGTVDAKVYRNDRIPAGQTGGISVHAAQLDLPATVGATVRDGTWLNAATARYPAVVLGAPAAAAARHRRGRDDQVWLGGSGSPSSASSTRCRWRPSWTRRR